MILQKIENRAKSKLRSSEMYTSAVLKNAEYIPINVNK